MPLLYAGRYRQAIPLFADYLGDYPDDRDVRREYALTLAAAGYGERAIPVLEIADGETATFERGGKHLMLMRPVDEPDAVTLNFYSDDTLLLTVDTEFAATMD